jgi:hypothetical protein
MAASPVRPAPVEVFFSYAHEDEPFVDVLRKHLGILKRLGVIRYWHDRKITAGTEWKGQIDKHLNSAAVILLLVSPDFVASDYCWDVELKRALERHKEGEARVIPVILRPTHGWKDTPLGNLLAAPTNGWAVTLWSNRDQAFADVARHIETAVQQLRTSTVGRTTPSLPHRDVWEVPKEPTLWTLVVAVFVMFACWGLCTLLGAWFGLVLDRQWRVPVLTDSLLKFGKFGVLASGGVHFILVMTVVGIAVAITKFRHDVDYNDLLKIIKCTSIAVFNVISFSLASCMCTAYMVAPAWLMGVTVTPHSSVLSSLALSGAIIGFLTGLALGMLKFSS